MFLSEKMGLRPRAWGEGPQANDGHRRRSLPRPFGERSRVSEAAGRVSDTAGRVSEAAGRVSDAAGRMTGSARASARLAAASAGSSLTSAAEAVAPDVQRRRRCGGHDEADRGDGRRGGRGATDAARGTAHDMRDQASGAVEQMRRGAQNVADTMKETAASVRDAAAEVARGTAVPYVKQRQL